MLTSSITLVLRCATVS